MWCEEIPSLEKTVNGTYQQVSVGNRLSKQIYHEEVFWIQRAVVVCVLRDTKDLGHQEID